MHTSFTPTAKLKEHHIGLSVRFALFGALSCVSATTYSQDTDSAADLEKIIVTGQKYDRGLQETPASVRVITARDIEEENINNLDDVLDRTANVTSLERGFNIRGIDAFSVSGGGSSFLASVYVDGAVMPERAIQHDGLSTWDVNQVEILRGPQSTLQGRNALAGAIIMRTQDPTYDWQGKTRLVAGNYGQRQGALAFGGPILDNQLAFRISAEKQDFDGYISNLNQPNNSDYEEQDSLRIKLLAEPDAIPEFRALFTYSNNEREHGPRWTDVPTGSNQAERFAHRSNSFNDPTFEFTESTLSTLELSYDLNSHWSLHGISAHSEVVYGYEWDGDGSAAPGNILTDRREDETFSQELRLNFDYQNLVGVAGLYYSDLEVNDASGGTSAYSLTTLGVPTLLVTPPEYGGIGLSQQQADMVMALYAGFDPAIVSSDSTLYQKIRTKALFADFTWKLSEQLDLLGGARYDRESRANSSNSQYQIANLDAMPDPANPMFDPMTAALIGGLNNQLIAFAVSASGNEPLVDEDFSAFLPKLGLSWRWNADIATSFIVQKGYRSGGVGINIAQSNIYSYDAEYTWNYELSLRSTWLDGALTANANLFYLDWSDQQVSVQLSGNRYDVETRNAGSSEVYGFETEFFYQATRNLSAYLGLGYNHTEFTDFTVVLPTDTYDLSGRSFVEAPDWTFKLGFTYRSDEGFIFNLNGNYQSDALSVVNPYQAPRDDAAFEFDPRTDARWLVNMRTGYEWENVGLFLTANNLFNTEYVQSPNSGGGFETLGTPRTWSLRLEASF